ncbi:DUF1129 domain-containing protein [Fructobacillus sp. M1-13]|uniref:DUF1129 domain-containing protein n=1 Tax=Fructobacillus papyriferae TaxID=2713171 RepID=A0ABS5QRU1_9LACO|nr:DUF1129 family protein [Fructobacillus papyriferae]MBS9335116.1 DUF1129 domain-containing protein [Fructobacillus papyriferae]MCD2159398.1 DUF1129 domain-containing protein [Fructobacillus papyriferae]
MTEVEHKLTKKNQDFLFRLNKGLADSDQISEEQKEEILAEVEEKLTAGQKLGHTAAQLFGTPAEAMQKYLNPVRLAKGFHDYSFAFLAADTALVLIMFLTGFFTVTMAFSGSKQGSEGIGMTSVLFLAIWGGVIYTKAMQRLVPNANVDPNKKRMPVWLMMILVVVLWVGGFSMILLLPSVINPVLPVWGNAIVFFLAFIAYIWNRKHAGLKQGGLLAISRLAQQERMKQEEEKRG